jgi:AraC-like DNA-binding protein
MNVVSGSPVSGVAEMIPDSLQKYGIPGTSPVVISGEFGHFIFQEFLHDDEGPYIRYDQYLMAEEQHFNFYSERPQLRLQFVLTNNFHLDMAGIGKWKVFQGTYNLFFVPFLDSHVTLKPGKVYSTLNIYFEYEDLARLGGCSPLLQDFLVKVKTGQPALLHAVNQPMTVTMEHIIKQIFTSHQKGPIQSIFLENKITGLLISCFDPRNVRNKIADYNNEEEDLQKMYAARQLWLEDLQAPASLSALAKKTGLNINKLTAGFKKLFGYSPYGLLLNARMVMAEHLLNDTDLSISDISDRAGYGGIQSFSKAFKLFYNESPLQYRKINSTRLDK